MLSRKLFGRPKELWRGEGNTDDLVRNLESLNVKAGENSKNFGHDLFFAFVSHLAADLQTNGFWLAHDNKSEEAKRQKRKSEDAKRQKGKKQKSQKLKKKRKKEGWLESRDAYPHGKNENITIGGRRTPIVRK